MDFQGGHQFAKYQSFRLGSEAEKYKLVLGTFVGGSAGERPAGQAWGAGRGCSLSQLCVLWVMHGGGLSSPQFLHPHVGTTWPPPACPHKDDTVVVSFLPAIGTTVGPVL